MRLVNLRSGDTIADTVEPAFDSSSRRRGLLGRDTFAAGSAVVIAPCQAIHTFFMRFAIDILFVGRDGRVLKVRQALPSGRISGALRAFAVIELPAGTLARIATRPGDLVAFTSAPAGDQRLPGA